MKLQDLFDATHVNEASYTGNIGMMEMFKFYQIATDEEKAKMRGLIRDGKQAEAWEFLQKVTGVKLKEDLGKPCEVKIEKGLTREEAMKKAPWKKEYGDCRGFSYDSKTGIATWI